MSANAYQCVRCCKTELARDADYGRGDWLSISVLSHVFTIGSARTIETDTIFCSPSCAIETLSLIEEQQRKRRTA